MQLHEYIRFEEPLREYQYVFIAAHDVRVIMQLDLSPLAAADDLAQQPLIWTRIRIQVRTYTHTHAHTRTHTHTHAHAHARTRTRTHTHARTHTHTHTHTHTLTQTFKTRKIC